MITLESVNDILDANYARTASGKEPLLTLSGKEVLEKLRTILTPIPQEEIDKMIQSTLH